MNEGDILWQEGRSGQVREHQTVPLQEELGILEAKVHFCTVALRHFLLRVVSPRASPAGCESDDSFSQRRSGDAPVGVSDEVAGSPRSILLPSEV